VNIPDVDVVVHWGAPRAVTLSNSHRSLAAEQVEMVDRQTRLCTTMDMTGRDGRQANSIVYYDGHDW
jgi:hypothetical protein